MVTRAVGARRRQDLRAQDRGVQRRARLAHGRVEERRDEVVEGSRDLGLDHGLGQTQLTLVAGDDLVGVAAPVQHLDVVHGHHRNVSVLREQIAPALEVRDDHVRLELVRQLEVRADVLGPALDRAFQIGEQGAEGVYFVVLVDDAVAPDLAHRQVLASPLDQIVVGAARNHDLDVVVLRQVVQHHPRTHGVTHALAHDSVQDAHIVVCPRACGGDFNPRRSNGRSPSRRRRHRVRYRCRPRRLLVTQARR